MMMHPWIEQGLALGAGALGCFGVMALVVVMNNTQQRPDDGAQTAAVQFEVQPPKPKPPPTRRTQRARPRRSQQSQAPAPIVGANLAGMSFGLESLQGALGDDMASLLGDVNSVVMTAETVDELPSAIRQISPQVPAQARARGIEGMVMVNLLIGIEGQVEDIRVVESRPPNVFDDAVVDAVRQWTFTPAMYAGEPVSLRIDYPFRFQFN